MTENRPWGSFTVFADEAHFKAKRLDVLAGKKLSLQSHNKRSEHWVVVAGCARITLGDKVCDYTAGDYIFIPLAAKHRIENPGNTLVTIVEIQLGEYFGEDDIIRYEDDFGRTTV